jgi:hypothetical protein
VSAGDAAAAREPVPAELAAGTLEGTPPVALHADAARVRPAASSTGRMFEKDIKNLTGQWSCREICLSN